MLAGLGLRGIDITRHSSTTDRAGDLRPSSFHYSFQDSVGRTSAGRCAPPPTVWHMTSGGRRRPPTGGPRHGVQPAGCSGRCWCGCSRRSSAPVRSVATCRARQPALIACRDDGALRRRGRRSVTTPIETAADPRRGSSTPSASSSRSSTRRRARSQPRGHRAERGCCPTGWQRLRRGQGCPGADDRHRCRVLRPRRDLTLSRRPPDPTDVYGATKLLGEVVFGTRDAPQDVDHRS